MADTPRSNPSLDLLRGFESAGRHLNFTRAADELFLTQSAVSRQIKTLEERLGVKLFARHARGLRLTEQGEVLYRAVSQALRQVHDAMQSLSGKDPGKRVTVTSTMAFCALWLVPRLGRFHNAYPDVDVRVAAGDRVLNLERERIDVSIRYCAPHAAPPGSIRLFDEILTPVCSPGLLEQSKHPLRSARDLEHFVLLHLDEPDNPAPWLSWGTWLEAAGIKPLKPAGALRFNYSDQVVRAALAGQGVALGRLPLVQDLLDDGTLVAPFLQSARPERAFFVLTSALSRGRREVEQFVEWIQASAHEAQTRRPHAAAPNTGPLARSRSSGPAAGRTRSAHR